MLPFFLDITNLPARYNTRMIEDEAHLWKTWRDLAELPEVDEVYQGILNHITTEIQNEGPTCWASGKCCHFESYEHDLLATGFEIMWTVMQLEKEARHFPEDVAGLVSMDGCPYQIEGKCSVHTVRPMGCRIYYCDPDHQDFQSPLYEDAIRQLKDLHEAHDIPYRLLEWRRGLAALFKHMDHPQKDQLYQALPIAPHPSSSPQTEIRVQGKKLP